MARPPEAVGIEPLHRFFDRLRYSSPGLSRYGFHEMLKEAVQVRSSYPAPHTEWPENGRVLVAALPPIYDLVPVWSRDREARSWRCLVASKLR